MTYAPAPWTPPVRAPGEARTAAVLGFVEAGLGTGVLLVGSFSVLRGTGRRALLRTSAGEIVFALGLAGWSLADPSGPYAVGTGDLLITTVLVSAALGAALSVVGLVFAAQPVVGAWVRYRSQAPEPRRTGLVTALLAPVGLMMAASIWVVAAPGQADYADVRAAAPDDWDVLYDGGVPVTPPSAGAPAYDAAFDADARRCHDGDMAACDELWFSTPPGSLY